MTRAERMLTVAMPADLRFLVERVTRIELALSAWEADVLPLNYTRAGEHEDTGRAEDRWLVPISYRSPRL
jgi:hypothetical protein